MRRIVDTIRRARPETRLTLEMITRDPLKVPCLTDAYWATFPERNGAYLARTMRMVRDAQGRPPLPVLTGLAREEQVRREENNVQLSHDLRARALGAISGYFTRLNALFCISSATLMLSRFAW